MAPAVSLVCELRSVLDVFSSWSLVSALPVHIAAPAIAEPGAWVGLRVGAVLAAVLFCSFVHAKHQVVADLVDAETWPWARKLLAFILRLGCVVLALKVLLGLEPAIVDFIIRQLLS